MLTKTIGMNKSTIMFPINVIKNKSIGPILFADIVLPVATIKIMSIGINELENPY